MLERGPPNSSRGHGAVDGPEKATCGGFCRTNAVGVLEVVRPDAVQTDHSRLQWLMHTVDPTGKIESKNAKHCGRFLRKNKNGMAGKQRSSKETFGAIRRKVKSPLSP